VTTRRRVRWGLLAGPALLAACVGVPTGTPTKLSSGQAAEVKALIANSLTDPKSTRFGSMNAAWQKDALVVCGWLDTKMSTGEYGGDMRYMARFTEAGDKRLDLKLLRLSDNPDGSMVAAMLCANAGLAFPGR
jgi:hypothetical protein